jgi:hypothetical protein
MDAQTLMQQFAGMAPGGSNPSLGASMGGSLDAMGDLKKALEASSYQTDVSTLTGGGALGVQSLDTAMKTTIQEQEHFVLFKRLQQTNATNIVDEYTRQTGVGGFLGGSTNSQMGVVRAAQGEYSREVGLVKFLMTLRQVGYVLNIGKNIVEATAVEERNGALQLMTDAEYLLFYGNAAACPTEFDGIFAQIDKEIAAGGMSGTNVVDMQGLPLDTIEPFAKINASVFDYGSWGRITDVFMPTAVQTDLNMGLDPAFRWSPDGGNQNLAVGAHVSGIRLTEGVLKTNIDTFLQHSEFVMSKPFELSQAATANANNSFKPAAIAVDAATSDAASQFTAPRAGNYYYAVAGVGGSGQGQSTILKSGQIAVAAGKKAAITITVSASGTETGYAIYRGRQNGTDATDDLRLMCIIPRTGASTVYNDVNREIPGTCKVPVLNLAQSADAIGWRQYQPMTKIPLPFGVGGVPVISWLQMLFGYLRVTKPKHHGYIKNIVPKNATWRPFSA